MWAIKNHTPYRAASGWWRDKDGRVHWLVGVKATYRFDAEGRVELAQDQQEALTTPLHRGEPGLSSLRYDADVEAPKPTTDVVLNATAYAPNGMPSSDFLAALRVGDVQKALRIRGDRVWERGPLGLRASRARPLSRLPIEYERAFGGYDRHDPDPGKHRIDLRNPVGRGIEVDPQQRLGQPLANLEYPDGKPESAGPAGFGPIDHHWSPRREWQGTYDATWVRERRPLLARDWDARALCCAPPDQRPARLLTGGETVELIHLTPQGRLRFALPRVHLGFSTHIDGRVEEHRPRLSSVIIEPDDWRLMLVWTTSLACGNDVDYLEHTVVREKRLI